MGMAENLPYRFTLRKGIPTQAECKRCMITFRYMRFGRRRYYCEPCVEKRKVESNEYYNYRQKLLRQEARENARLCHGKD